MDDIITLLHVLAGIAVLALLIALIVKAVRKPGKVSSREKEAVSGLSLGDRIYIYFGSFFFLQVFLIGLVGMALEPKGFLEIGVGLGYIFGPPVIAFVIAYVAYGRKARWHAFARLFCLLCVVFAILLLSLAVHSPCLRPPESPCVSGDALFQLEGFRHMC